MKIRFLDLSIKSKIEFKEQLKVYKKFLKEGKFVLGPYVDQFEKKISQIVKKKYTIGCSSGTNAIYLALKATGIKKDDHVLVPSMSWVSTFTAVQSLGAVPIGVEIDDDFIISFDDIKKKITKKTKAIIIVYFTGYYKKIKELKDYCKKRNVTVIEDCAQSFGSSFNQEPNGKSADIACFSMNPMKVYGGYGDAGAVCVDNLKIANKIKSLRYAGTINKELVIDPDLNHKIDSLQALILLKQLKFLKAKINKRIKNAEFYQKNLTSKIIKPKFFSDYRHVYYTYSIMVKNRKKLIDYLNKKGIETKVQHPFIISDHPGLKNKYNKGLSKSKSIAERILSIPIHEKLKKSELKYITFQINKFYN